MPEYLAPGVFVEETSYRAKTLEGVSTTTTGFVGPTRSGPVCLEPDLVTNLSEFEQVYGDGQPLVFGATTMPNFMWHAARAFFSEGGKRLYVSRTFLPLDTNKGAATSPYAPVDATAELIAAKTADSKLYLDGHARYMVPVEVQRPEDPTKPDSPLKKVVENQLAIRYRHPGAAGNLRVRVSAKLGRNLLGVDANGKGVLGTLSQNDLVWIYGSQPSETDAKKMEKKGDLYLAQWNETDTAWNFKPKSGDSVSIDELVVSPNSGEGDTVRVVTLSISLLTLDGSSEIAAWNGLPVHPDHATAGMVDSLFVRFANTPASIGDARRTPLVIAKHVEIKTAFDVLPLILGGTISTPNSDNTILQFVAKEETTPKSFVDLILTGGHDGARPTSTEYEGKSDPTKLYSTGLKQFEEIEDISIVAAPGITWGYAGEPQKQANATMALLIAHAEKMRYRIAVLDSAQGQTISDVRNMRAKIDSKHAALYYPWVKIVDPITRLEADFPPSGFVAGIYARNDVERGVWKAPANEVVRLATGFESNISKAQQEVLNPEGINCFRFFEGRGNRLWGARTISSDPEWKYVNVRRYFAYLERTIEKGTQWAVFEPNGDHLWANVRRTIEDFLLNEWQSGALLGSKPEQAYFVRCDRSTMSQNDLDNGRLICQVGVAPIRPAEFVVFRVGQWTADRRG
ncbi:MAG TPA: phage tail sheath subtilisin-like domain-containing protein [Fibrobacteria bacterium]|nr:phage tail sheath subtilisin-like domain-containing protein [Fibrobacteria bacterium]